MPALALWLARHRDKAKLQDNNGMRHIRYAKADNNYYSNLNLRPRVGMTIAWTISEASSWLATTFRSNAAPERL
jgi:hypothetical protein